MSLRFSNTTSDYMEWDTLLNLIRNLYRDKNYKMSLFIAIGAFWGLRVSDILELRWSQILNVETIEIIEKKTKKKRLIKINSQLQKHIHDCYMALSPANNQSRCFISQKGSVYSIQRLNVILKELKVRYNIKISHFSTHTLRKTFGREIYNEAGNNAEFALVKLSELFNHSDVRTTKRYLGIRHDELMEAYELLRF